ncbi:MAG TPA: DUF3881 family protein [Blastocatellia bacterium]|jgi:hypothetical protein|nr:DUF3881 family protein [Blastocatellia bacterium]
MSKSLSGQPLDPESANGAVMAELFEAVGFEITDENSYNSLVEFVDVHGQRTRTPRGNATLHGRCWKLGEGLEIWSIVYECGPELYYADCRPAFRSRYVRTILPWELIEYDEDGEAIVRGCIQGGQGVVFELQNLTELNQSLFREGHLHVALAGLAYSAYIDAAAGSEPGRNHPSRFIPAEQVAHLAEDACENDYVISGHVLAWRDVRNSVTGNDLIWIYVDASRIRLEILINRRALRGELKIGVAITANVWLQGHVLEQADISARYEGVDQEYEPSDFWTRLRRDN